MKITKKITSIVLALLLAVSAFAGLAITANAAYPTDNVTLTIHKYQIDEGSEAANGKIGNTPNSKPDTQYTPTGDETPIKGVTFSAYKIGEMTDVVPATDPDNYVVTDITPLTGTTDDNGVATITVAPSAFGLYVVKETASPASVTTTAKSFYVYLPSTKSDGSDWLTNVDVWPKNLVTLGGAVLTKTINNAPITADTTLVVPPKFKLVEYNDNTEGAAIATGIEAKAGFNAVTKATGLDSKYDTVVIAQKDGTIAVDGLPVGTYAFIETDAAQIVAGTNLPIDSTPRVFTVSQGYNVDVTTTNEDGFGTITKITAGDNGTYSFTMDNSTEPTVSKAVDKTNAQIGENVTWTITPVVPADIATYQKYVVTDQIVDELDIKDASAVTVTATGATLTNGTDYTIDVTNKLVTVDFTATGRETLATATKLEIAIVTQINSEAEVDQAIKNKAELEYQNSFQTESKKTPSNEPETTTGAFKIEKVDAADDTTKLDGVEFTLTDNTGAAVGVTYDDANNIYVVDPTSNTNTVVTANGGIIFVKGLAYKTYTLTETKTNNGYQLLKAPVDISVIKGISAEAITIENVKQPDLPLTGGVGTVLFYVAGLALIGGGAFFFLRSRKAKKEEI
ncbi:MAG: SpaH/EbpB family LPXTG-anchored major pilin [Acutalibacteraceae bacterium]